MIGGAAKKAQTRSRQIPVRPARIDGSTQFIRLLVEIEAAAFDHHDAERLVGELKR
jgi:hypothetical protein